MSRAGRAPAVALVVLLLAALGSLAPAGAAPAGTTAPPAQAPAPAPTQAGLEQPDFVQLQVTGQSPSVVTATGTTTVTVTGRLVNVGDRDVTDLEIRLQRAPALTSEADLRETLRTVPDAFDTVTDFTPATPRLSPGASAPFTATAQLTGTGSDGLGVTTPGTYPLVLNVNGEPDFGDRAKLDQAAFLLPVLGLPADPAAGRPTATSPTTTTPVGTTVLWPLADVPRVLPTTAGPTTLSDDDLATSFARGGRLDGLLSAVETRTAAAADPAGALARSLCLAVDPDLLVTAQAMVEGYQVSDGAGGTVPGTGGAAAGAWLDRLRGLAQGLCVQALPWAQADLDALTRAGLTTLQTTAVTAAEQVVSDVLDRAVTAGTTWPTSGALEPATATTLAASGQRTVLVSADAVRTAAGQSPAVGTAAVALDGGLSGLLLDPPVATALAATGAVPTTPSTLVGSVDAGSTAAQRVLRVQDAVGALAFAPLAGSTGVAAAGVPRSVLVAPPQYWSVDGDEAAAVLDGLAPLLAGGLAAPAPLPEAITAARTTAALDPPAATLSPPVASTAGAAPGAGARAAGLLAGVDRFVAAAATDPQVGVTPTDLVAPLRLGLLRALRTGAGQAAAGRALDDVAGATTTLTDQVSLVAPGGSYTLASRSSPLLLTVRNELPVAVSVQVRLAGPPGIVTGDVGTSLVPARSNLPLQVPTTVGRSGQFAVDATLVTPTGEDLGTATRLLVRSTAYGAATAAVVAAAAGLLLLLVARRLLHRLRGQPDRADEGRVPR